MTDELRKLAEAATPLDLSTAQKFRDGEYIECPVCNGEGGIDAKDYCNIDGHAIGVQIYGIGEKMVAMENFVKAANPTAVIALLDELTALRAKVKAQAEAGYGAWLVECNRFKNMSLMLEGFSREGDSYRPIWSQSHDKAIRFKRKEDATAMAANMPEWEKASAVEHVWIDFPGDLRRAAQEATDE